jgi:nicotinate phosphoribosyltransferase
MGAIYKLVEIEHDGKTRFTAKDSAEKHTLPGAKQLFRYPDFDLLARHNECSGGAEAMLKPVIVGGNLIAPAPSLREIRTRAQASLAKWPEPSRRTELSPALQELNRVRQ